MNTNRVEMNKDLLATAKTVFAQEQVVNTSRSATTPTGAGVVVSAQANGQLNHVDVAASSSMA